MIFGSKRCDACSVHYDWVGSVENVENEQITNLITRNRTLVFARFKQEYNPDQYTIITKCPFCRSKNESFVIPKQNKPA